MPAEAGENQCEVVLVGCGLPGRGMGWYHCEQLLKDHCPSAKLCYIVEPWFLGPVGECLCVCVVIFVVLFVSSRCCVWSEATESSPNILDVSKQEDDEVHNKNAFITKHAIGLNSIIIFMYHRKVSS